MSANVKMAALVSLGFIAAISWMVTRVSQPSVEIPLPARRTADAQPVRPAERDSVRFAHRSPLESTPQELRDRPRLVLSETPNRETSAITLPPLNPASVQGMPEIQLAADTTRRGEGVPLIATQPADFTNAGLEPEISLLESAPVVTQVQTNSERTYMVRRGDSLVKIARKEMKGVDERSAIAAILNANGDLRQNPNHITVGQVLRIPDLLGSSPEAETPQAGPRSRESATAMQLAQAPSSELRVKPAAHTETRPKKAEKRTAARPGSAPDKGKSSEAGKPVPKNRSIKADKNSEPASPKRSGKGRTNRAETNVRWYTVQKSDSLSEIARRHLRDGRRWREIVEMNRSLDDKKPITPGTRIKLPGA